MALVRLFRRQGGNLGKSYQPGSMLSLAPTKGLLNEPGQNSCFLNSAVQVLWHLDIFRRSLRQLPGHFCLGESCIFCELKAIFFQFQRSRERALPSDKLRVALAETFKDEHRFQLGYMDDAAECFENILERIHLHIVPEETDACTSKSCITHQKFAMSLYEQSVCRSCGASSDPLPFTELVHYISTTALCQQMHQRRHESFGELLQAARSIGELRNCPSRCGQRIGIRQVLMNSPEIVTIGFVWDSDQSDHTDNVIRSLGPHLSLSALFYRVTDEHAKKAELQLVGMICYTSRHYCAFAFHTKSSKWVLFDDASVKEIGSRWKDVVSKCLKEHFQPLLLFYSDPEGSAITPEDALKQHSGRPHSKGPANGEVQAVESPTIVPKKMELTKENLTALLGAGSFKQKTPSTFSRGSAQTSGGRGPVKIGTSDPKSRLRELSKEVAQRAGELRGLHPSRREPDRSSPRRQESRYRDPAEDRTYSRSVSPPGNGFTQHLETRLYSSQGKGPIRSERTPHYGGRSSQEPPHSHPRQVMRATSGASHHSRRLEHLSNGYDTDSSQDSRERPGSGGNSRSRPTRAWKPMREALNVDSVLSSSSSSSSSHPVSQERRQHSPNRRSSSQSPSRDRAAELAWSGREECKPKSLMTIYEDEQKHETGGSHSSLDSDSRGGYSDMERPKGSATLKVRNDNWKIQRTESGYESSDRLSNGSTNLDSPVVENNSFKDLRPIPELHLTRDHLSPRRRDDSNADLLHSNFSPGEHRRISPELQDVKVLSGQPMQRRRAFRYTPGILDSGREKNLEGSPVSPVPPYLAKTSSSEWNSSDDLAGPLSEQEDSSTGGNGEPFSHSYLPPLLPKTFGSYPDSPDAHSRSPGEEASPWNKPRNGLSPLSHTALRRWIETPAEYRLSSDASSKSGSSDQDRNELSASESEEPASGPKLPHEDDADSARPLEMVLPTTYFSVDNCMTDTYRAKYHKRPGLYMRAEEHTSSGESDAEGRKLPVPDVQLAEPFRSRSESGYSTAKTTAKWNPVTPKGLDEHGFL
ncbi:ubiquitin carboxyl-terminal hydrolase 53 [Nelusetta ayraudi]|uniref:ubiquitin carboxyl-terminal hydrolase 53 n=1 Tax=Nelusetta ayraudi TaxID=303726 RepID=UPI003F6E4E95